MTEETFGLTRVGAFARKTPVVVRFARLPEIVEDSGGGFAYRTEEELRAALKQIAASFARSSRGVGQKRYRARALVEPTAPAGS